jgi:uncharacterized protein
MSRTGVALAAAMAAVPIAISVSPAAAANPSFDCSGTLAPTEKVICADETLAALDRMLAAAFKNKFDGLPVESANALEEVVLSLVVTQKAWLAHRNACGTDIACIYRAYTLRKAALTAGDNVPDTPCRDMVGAEQAAVFVRQCMAMATETHPPCNAANTCELIVSHNITRCREAGDQAPKFCAGYLKR